jgi:predicted metal-dependent peptidase
VPGNLSTWAAHKPEPPKRKIPWQRHLLNAVGGEGEANRTSSYSRIYRRQDCYGWDDIIMPGEESQGYQIGIIVDTSGSMRRYMAGLLDSLTALLRTVEGSQVEAAFCTTSVQAVSRFAKITSANEHLFGVGGGTNLCCGFEYFDKKRRDKPRLVIVATDGETPYPYRSKHDYKVIVLLTKNCDRRRYPIPTNYTIIETY